MPYLKLFHGRDHPDQQLDDWGEPGPVFGPFPYFHTTYCADIKFDDGAGRLLLLGDLVYYDRMFYGDWSVFDGPLGEEDRQRLVTFEMEKARLPHPRPTLNSPPSTHNHHANPLHQQRRRRLRRLRRGSHRHDHLALRQ